MLSRRLIAFGILLLSPMAAHADLTDVRDALERGRHEAALDELVPMARGGEPEAQVLLGDVYYNGIGVAQNYSLAWSWYMRAAESGDALAQYKLATMFWKGIGVPRNEGEAVDWYLQAAEGGNPDAQLELGLIYRDGRRQIPKSAVKAQRYLRMAAEQGNIEAEVALEEMYVRGLAPREEQERYRAEQADRAMSEPERIRKAIADWIDDYNRRNGGAGAPRPDVVVTDSDGSFTVLVPDLVVTPGPGRSVRLGTVRATLVPEGDAPSDPEIDLMSVRRYRAQIALPGRFEMQDGLKVVTVTYEPAVLEGLFLPSAQLFIQGDLTLDSLVATDQAGHTVFTARSAGLVAALEESDGGKWNGPITFGANGIELFDRSGTRRAGVDRVWSSVSVENVEADTLAMMFVRDPDRVMPHIPQTEEDMARSLTNIAGSTEMEIGLEGLSVFDETGDPQGGLGEASIKVGSGMENLNSARLSFSYRHGGLDVQETGPQARLIPRTAAVALAVDRIPLYDLALVAMGMMGQAMVEAANTDPLKDDPGPVLLAMLGGRAQQAMADAATEVTVDMSLDAPASQVAVGGTLVAHASSPLGVAGSVDIAVTDLDELIAEMSADPANAAYAAMLQAFAKVAEEGNGPGGGDAAIFHVTVEPDGSVLVNGQDALAVTAGGMEQ